MAENQDVVKETGKGTIEEYAGNKLDKPIDFTFDFNRYTSKNAAIAAGVWPGDADAYVLARVNATQKNNARQTEYLKRTEKLREDYEKTDEFKLKSTIANLKITKPNWTDEKREQFARSLLAAD